MKTKTFDCVEMKRRGAEVVHARIAGMTTEQELEYWLKRNAEFRHDNQGLAVIASTGSQVVQAEADEAINAI